MGRGILSTLLEYEILRRQNPEYESYTRTYYWYRLKAQVTALVRAERKEGGPLRVLDLGCGYADYLFSLKDAAGHRGDSYCGADISFEQVWFAEERKQAEKGNGSFLFVNCRAERLPFREGIFDVVVCAEVLEHCVKPEETVREIRRMLKPGGLAVVTTPNLANPLRKLKRSGGETSGECGVPAQPVDPFSHVSVKSWREWLGMFSRAGFGTAAVRRGSLLFGGRRWDKHPLCFAFVLFLDRLLDAVPWAVGCSENVVMALRKE